MSTNTTPATSVMAATTAAIAASSKSKPEPKMKTSVKVQPAKSKPVAAKKTAPAKKAAVKASAPAKKTVAKKPSKPAYRTDYKPDTRVKVTRRDGTEVSGRVVKIVKRTTGCFIDVNVGTKQMPIMLSMRPAKVKGF